MRAHAALCACQSFQGFFLRRFRANEVIKAVKALLDERLKGKKYDSSESAQLSKELCTEIKEKVKEIGAPRHKLVVQVTIGEVQGQGVRIASRCLWDVETDNHASAYYTNPYCESPFRIPPPPPPPPPPFHFSPTMHMHAC